MQKTELEEILEPIQGNQRVQMMKQFIQHGFSSFYFSSLPGTLALSP